ncbi:hypothetical protein ACH5RR_025494 [Cinchona calisaya]|uniref:Uncharacterized protein n=1 Tax=Cinchona calisaya TaxID=153742 RepID=A0ABD2Z3U2_9GENT
MEQWKESNSFERSRNLRNLYGTREKAQAVEVFRKHGNLLKPFEYELLTVSPVIILTKNLLQFAPIGLVNMLNSGGALEWVIHDDDKSSVSAGVGGCGEMRVFASEKPVSCTIDGIGVDFSYDHHMVMIQISWPNSLNLSVIKYVF